MILRPVSRAKSLNLLIIKCQYPPLKEVEGYPVHIMDEYNAELAHDDHINDPKTISHEKLIKQLNL